VAATLVLLIAALGCRRELTVGDPPRVVSVGLTPWHAGLSFHLVAAERRKVPATSHPGDGHRAELVVQPAVDAGAKVTRPTMRPWGWCEFELGLPEGHQLMVSTPS
jgi:hypothetical protein